MKNLINELSRCKYNARLNNEPNNRISLIIDTVINTFVVPLSDCRARCKCKYCSTASSIFIICNFLFSLTVVHIPFIQVTPCQWVLRELFKTSPDWQKCSRPWNCNPIPVSDLHKREEKTSRGEKQKR